MFCAWYVTYVAKGMQAPNMGARIKEARETQGLSQTALAERMGAGERTVQAWERNERTPRIDALTRLAAVLEVSVADFFAEPEREAA